jgi:hypothetical protein
MLNGGKRVSFICRERPAAFLFFTAESFSNQPGFGKVSVSKIFLVAAPFFPAVRENSSHFFYRTFFKPRLFSTNFLYAKNVKNRKQLRLFQNPVSAGTSFPVEQSRYKNKNSGESV